MGGADGLGNESRQTNDYMLNNLHAKHINKNLPIADVM